MFFDYSSSVIIPDAINFPQVTFSYGDAFPQAPGAAIITIEGGEVSVPPPSNVIIVQGSL